MGENKKRTVEVFCDTTDNVTGGGYELVTSFGFFEPFIFSSSPNGTSGWSVGVDTFNQPPGNVIAYAVCADTALPAR